MNPMAHDDDRRGEAYSCNGVWCLIMFCANASPAIVGMGDAWNSMFGRQPYTILIEYDNL